MKFRGIKIGLMIITLIGIVGVSFLVPYCAQQKKPDEYIDQEENILLKENGVVSENITEDIEKEEQKKDIAAKIIVKKERIRDTEEKNKEEEKKEEKDTKVVIDSPQINESEEKEQSPIPVVLEKENKETWVDAKIEEYKDQIDKGDIEDFRKIIGKLDMDYAISLLDKPDGENELKLYMRSKLNKEEYERSKELFFLYNYILFE